MAGVHLVMRKRLLFSFIVMGLASLQMLSYSVAADSGPTATKSQPAKVKTSSTLVALGGRTIQAAIADTDKTLTEGLLGRDRISEEEGMLLDFTRPGQYAIHMQGMKFAIDALWIDTTGVIKLIYQEIPPNSGRVYPSMFSCRYCLEIKAGFCKKYGVKAGETVRFGVSPQ